MNKELKHTSEYSGAIMLGPGVRGGVDWMRKLAFRYRRIKELYKMYRENVPGMNRLIYENNTISGLLTPEIAQQWRHLRQEIENSTDSWCSLALKALRNIHRNSSAASTLTCETIFASLLKVYFLFANSMKVVLATST